MKKYLLPLLVVIASALARVHHLDHKPKIDPTFSWRIVGGSNASDGQFPYQASLRGYSGNHACGGSILDVTTILIAAHCVKRAVPSKLSVVIGSNKLDSGGTRLNVSSVKIHEDFNPVTLKNDIAILKLATPIEFSHKVQPIELETLDVGAGVDVVLSGWGTTTYPGDTTPNDLQYINLKTISLSDCKSRHLPFPGVRDSHICTFTQKGEGACNGDSGSPLVAHGKLIGFVAWVRSCAKGYPDVFTRVSSFNDWIKENMN